MNNTFFVWPRMAVHLIILTYLTQLIFDKPIVCIIFILYNKIVVSVELLGHNLDWITPSDAFFLFLILICMSQSYNTYTI
jgi:hypothetical protein